MNDIVCYKLILVWVGAARHAYKVPKIRNLHIFAMSPEILGDKADFFLQINPTFFWLIVSFWVFDSISKLIVSTWMSIARLARKPTATSLQCPRNS